MPQAKLAAPLAAVIGLSLAALANAVPIYGLSTDNNLFRFDSTAPGTIISGSFITGLQTNETIVGIDFRPSTGQLYGVGSTSRVYTINTTTGAATAVGAQLSTLINGANFDMDFNPTVDLFRLVSDADQNLRINPSTGAVVNVDGTLAFTGALSGVNPNVAGIAYANNVGGAATTTLYAIDSGADVLATMNANAGTLTSVGALGIDVSSVLGFDIYTQGGVDTGLAVMQPSASGVSSLYSINLATGVATPIGLVGGGFLVKDLAVVVPEPLSASVTGVALLGLLVRRRR